MKLQELEIFAKRLKELRIKKGLSQKELSIQANISLYWLRNCENSVSQLADENLIKIVDFFNCSTDYLLGLKNL